MKVCRQEGIHGSALVMTLLVIVLLTVIVLAGFVTTRMSIQSSRSQLDAFTASEYAQDGVNQAIGLIRCGTSTTNQWTSQPGQITLYEPLNTNVVTNLSLHSGRATNQSEGVNVNAGLIQNPTEGVISYDVADSMLLRWIYVRKNGERTSAADYRADNPVVGRYAFWVDDETSKINLNTAWTRAPGNTNTASHPSQIPIQGALTNLTDTQVSEIIDYRSNKFFSSQLDLLKAFGTSAPALADDVRRAKFWTAHFNSSPVSDQTFFGEPKIVLTTKAERAGGRPYLNLDATGGAPTPAQKTTDLVASYLERIDWPMAPGESFQKKYYGGEKARVRQLALNIMEYVEARESTEVIVKPWRNAVTANKDHASPSRRPRIVEVGFWKNSDATIPSTAINARIYVLIYLPKNIGLTNVTASNWRLKTVTLPTNKAWNDLSVDFNVDAGKYFLYTKDCKLEQAGNKAAYYFQFVRSSPAGDLLDRYPNNGVVEFPVTVSASPDITTIQTRRVEDPFLGSSADDWKLTPGVNRLSDYNNPAKMRASLGLGSAPANPALGQDVDENGFLTDEGLRLPAPAGTLPANGDPGNVSGMVESLSELGYIHTGIQAMGQASVPFRTLRMQPRTKNAGYSADSIPDWAILDLFALPVKPTETNTLLYRPNARGGLVNLNSVIQPFTNITRSQTLRALVKDLPSLSATEQQEVAASLMKKTPAGTSLVAGKIYGSTNAFRFPGEIAEIKGVSDSGEASEQNFRQLIDLVTTSGNVFSVYAVGQSVVQSPNGKIIPRGEYRQVSIVERSKQAGDVKFRVLFNKALGN